MSTRRDSPPRRARTATRPAPRPSTRRSRPHDGPRSQAHVAHKTTTSPTALAPWLTGVLATLCVIGLVMVGSASSVISIEYYGSAWAISLRECLWMTVGVVAFLGAARLEPRTLRKFAVIGMVGALGLLVAVLAPGIGTSAFGSSRWLGAGILRVQPSELAKLALCLYAAHVITLKERAESAWGRVLRPVAIMTALCAGLVLMQPDMGTAAVVVAIAFAVVVVAGAPMRAVVTTIALLAAGGIVAIAASPYRRVRLLSFLNPQSNASGVGYQEIESKIGFGAGHVFGLGLGNSREKWGLLPNPHTDFIFSIIGEELGLLGSILILALLVTLVLLGLRVAREAPDRFSQLLAAGISAWLAAETVINVGAAVGVLPITGIPLPIISFGGTSLVIDMAAVGVLVGIARRAALPRPRLRAVQPRR